MHDSPHWGLRCTLSAVLAAAGEGGGPDMTDLIELLGEHELIELI